MLIIPALANAGPEGVEVAAGVDLVLNEEGAPLGPEKLDFRRHAEGREMLLGAKKCGLEVSEFELIVLVTEFREFFDDALLGFRRMTSLQPKFFHLRDDAKHTAKMRVDLPDARGVIFAARENGKAGTAGGAPLQAKIAAHHRVATFGLNGILVPEKAQEIVPVIGTRAALQDGFHVGEAIKGAPSLEVRLLPRAVFEIRMVSDFVLGIVKIEVRMHPLTTTQHVEMVHGARQGSKHEKGGMVRLDLFGEELHVTADGIHGVEGETEDVADVAGNVAVAVSLDELAIFLDLILFFAGGGEVARVDTFHADENGHAAGLTRLGDKVLDLPGKHIDLHHELDGYLFFHAQTDEVIEDGFPVLVAGEIVVGEKVEGDAVLVVIAADGLRDVLGGAEAHLATLYVDDGAESAFEGTT